MTTDKADEHNAQNIKSLDEVIYPEIEPGIISKQMIEKAYLEDFYKGEAARLHQIEPIIYDRITSIRMDFKSKTLSLSLCLSSYTNLKHFCFLYLSICLDILRIDHLWILPNLTKLVLSCNKIELIENIEMLTNLKELDLSFNYIEKIQNLEKLVNLEVLSLFNNLITKIENLESQEKLIILSIGNNQIYSTDGVCIQLNRPIIVKS